MRTSLAIILVILLQSTGISQQPHADRAQSDYWQPVRALIGTWQGEAQGEAGKGTVRRSYAFALRGAFIEVKNRSTYPPQKANAKGEIHEDHGFISYDKARKKLVLRQFHVEGFVNQYVLTSVSADGRTVVFETESIENIPSGWRARETYILSGKDELTERFELAEPGKEYALYSESKLRRSSR